MKNIVQQRKYKLTTLFSSLVSVSVILTILILFLSSYQSDRRSMISTYFYLNSSMSEKISSSVDSLFQTMRLSLEDTSAFYTDIDQMTDEEIEEHLELLRKNSRYFNSLSWIDDTGLIRNIAPSSVGLKNKYISTEGTKDVLESRKPTLTAPYIVRSGRLVLLMSQPIYDRNGQYRGILAGTVYLQEQNVLNEILGNDYIDENGSYYYVVGPEGKLLFHPIRERVGETVMKNPIVKKVTQGESGVAQVTNTKGVKMLAAYNQIPETGWGVVQQTPLSYVEKLLFKRIQEQVFYILPPFTLLLFLSVLLARKLARPIIHLADLVNQLAAGKSVETPGIQSHWNREADLLTKSVLIAIQSVQENNQELTNAAMTDSLTGLPNRRKLNEVMNLWASGGNVFSVVVVDIDRFKVVNDTYGHPVGDEVLKFLAHTVQSLLRTEDLFFRYGGEEFVLLLPHTRSFEAYGMGEKIRLIIEKTTTPTGKPVTISLGISEYPLHSNSMEELFRQADKALYQSKYNGRNLSTIWSKDINDL
ncbi:sensor domain-containing diguanylate cyclase [Bacillus sp. 2205SS5-2]|uniref:sensor domain-containing diguanylate cyclase n=1 Tax=Bacillus sp. 2205SS5-2 TaxID=3109031 RepID=UPI003005309F